MSSFSGQVSQSTDDAGENGNTNNVTTNSTTLGSSNTAYEYWGFRWQNVTIPNAATLSAATISLWISSGTTIGRVLDFNLATNPSTFVNNSTSGISGLTLTGDSATWSSTSLTTGAFNQSPSLLTAAQAIVNQGGWASGNAMIATAVRSGTNTAVAEAYDGSSSEAAEISITYTAGAAPGARRACPSRRQRVRPCRLLSRKALARLRTTKPNIPPARPCRAPPRSILARR